MFGDISKFSKVSDYLPIFNAALVTDFFIILLIHIGFFKSKFLIQWYNEFGLSAVIMDVFIIVIGFIITRYLYNRVFSQYSLVKFIILFLIVQVVHDFLFYMFFKNVVPRGSNKVMDLFKKYAQEVGGGAILGDSFMIVMSSIIASLLVKQSFNFNLIFVIVVTYLIPYFIFF